MTAGFFSLRPIMRFSYFLSSLWLSSLVRLSEAEHNVTFSDGASFLRVLNLNTWGLSWPWSEDREYRFRALREEIRIGDYDIVLLQEVWFRKDYDIIRSALPYTTFYRTLNANCFGSFLPVGCSGLTILSRHPMEDVKLYPFQFRGTFWNFDGEVFVGKGLAKARIRWNGLIVDVFTAHMISYTYHPNRDNALFRYMQTLETVRLIHRSDADIKLFGGDLNALPFTEPRQPYGMLCSIMTDTLTDKYPGASFHPWFATFGNERNTYTRTALPERIDYLFYSVGSPEFIKMKTYDYITPVLMTKNEEGKIVSLSDHEPIVAVFIVEKTGKRNSTMASSSTTATSYSASYSASSASASSSTVVVPSSIEYNYNPYVQSPKDITYVDSNELFESRRRTFI